MESAAYVRFARISAVLLTAVLCFSAFMGPVSRAASPADASSLSAEPSTVYVGWTDTVHHWNPLDPLLPYDYVVRNLMFSSLYIYDEDLSLPVMDLATGYSQIVNPDGSMTTTITITDSAYFRNAVAPDDMSHPLTASDVVFTLRIIIDYIGPTWDYRFANVTEANLVSAYSFEIVTDYPKATLIDDLCGIPILPEFQWSGVLPSNYLESVDPMWLYGSGPFYASNIDEWGGFYYFSKAPNYHGEADYGDERTVKVDEICYIAFPAAASAATAMNDGVLDAVSVDDDLDMYRDVLGNGTTVEMVKQAVTEYGMCDVAVNAIPMELRTISWGNGNPALLDPVVRQAVMMTLDKDYVVGEFMYGTAVKGDSVVSPGYWHKDIDPELSFDPAAARDLLINNGYSGDSDSDGLLEADADSYAVEQGWIPVGYELDGIRCQAPYDNAVWVATAYAWADAALEAGMGFAPEGVNEAALINDAWYSGDYDLWVWNWGLRYEPLEGILSLWLSSQLVPGGNNVQMPMGPWWKIVDEGLPTEHVYSAYDENYSAAMRALDISERKTYVDLLQQFIYDSYCENPPYYNVGLYAYKEINFAGWGDWEAHAGRSIASPLPWLWFDLAPVGDANIGPYLVSLEPSSNPVAAGFEEEFRAEAFDADGDTVWFYIQYGDGSEEVAQAAGSTDDIQYHTFSHSYDLPGSYSATLFADDRMGSDDSNVSVSVTVDVTEGAKNVAYRWYDMFNVPFGEYYDYRLISEGGYNVVSKTDTYPYLFDYQLGIGDVWTYSNMRLEVDAANLYDINMDAPAFVPLIGAELGGNTTVDWDMHYGTYDEITTNYSADLGAFYDGWMTVNKVDITMNETAAMSVLGITAEEFDDFMNTWSVRGAEISTWYRDWMSYQGNSEHDIFNSYEYPFTLLYWPTVCDAEKVGESVVLRLDFVSWGMEMLLTKWLRTTFMPTENYYEDFTMHAEIGESSTDLTIDTVVAFAVNAYSTVYDGLPCWRWEGRLQDVLPSSYSHPVSDFDPYEGLTFMNMEPGNAYYGTWVSYYYHTPGAFNLGAGETLTFEWPEGDQMFQEHVEPGVSANVTGGMTVTYAEPMPHDLPDNVFIDDVGRTVEMIGPVDILGWSANQTWHSFLDSEWDRLGVLPYGMPMIEFSMVASYTEPVASFTVTPDSGNVSTVFEFNASGSYDAEDSAEALQVMWDWESDGTWDVPWTTDKIATHEYSSGGMYTVTLIVRDTDDLMDMATVTVAVEGTAPVAVLEASPESGTVHTVFGFDASGSYDLEDESSALYVRWDLEADGVWDTDWSLDQVLEVSFPEPGTHTVAVEVMDSSLQTSVAEATVSVVDDLPPVTTVTPQGMEGIDGWYLSDVTVTLEAVDAESSVDRTMYSLSGTLFEEYTGPFLVDGEGSHTVSFYSVDSFEDVEETQTVSFQIDTIDPETSCVLVGAEGEAGWFTTAVEASLDASDDNGVLATYYSIDGSPWEEYSGAMTISAEGMNTLQFYSVDVAGNDGAVESVEVPVDLSGPSSEVVSVGTVNDFAWLEEEWFVSEVTVTVNASDVASGVVSAKYRIDGGDWRSYVSPFTISDDGAHLIECYATDAAGRVGATSSATVQLDQAPPTVTVLGFTTDGGSTSMNYVVSDVTSGVHHMTMSIDGGSIVTVNETGVSMLLGNLASGSHEINVTVYDSAGHSYSTVASFEVPAEPLLTAGMIYAMAAVASAVALAVLLLLLIRKKKGGRAPEEPPEELGEQ